MTCALEPRASPGSTLRFEIVTRTETRPHGSVGSATPSQASGPARRASSVLSWGAGTFRPSTLGRSSSGCGSPASLAQKTSPF